MTRALKLPIARPNAERDRWAWRQVVAVNIAEAVFALVSLIAAYGLAERLVADQEAAGPDEVAVRTFDWWITEVPVTLNMSLLVVGAAAGAVGSVIRQSMALTHRSRSLRDRSIWWYVLRPLWSAMLGSVSVIAVNTGLISIGDETTSSAGIAVLVLTGSLAGLFTDQVLRRLRTIVDRSRPGKN
ncbi:hypothetical protein ACQPXM_22915 [Kribbella sp. CA-253562]|uniref:hypothetical protein n=1 Tax=Kribbella sp. CA-253562 TaxID=3239942 RepID=UPI003D89FCB0